MSRRRLAATILDDSTPPRRVPLWDACRGGGEDLAPELRERINSAIQHQAQVGVNTHVKIEHVAVLAASVLTMVVIFGLLHLLFPMNDWHFAIAPVAGAIAGMVVMQTMALWRMRAPLRATLLAAGHCASCGYKMAAAVDSGGCTTCSECGAVWRLPGNHALIGDRPQWKASRGRYLLDAQLLAGRPRQIAFSYPDDRGHIVELVYPVPRRRPPTNWHTIPPLDRHAIESQIRSLSLSSRVLTGAVVLFMGIAVVSYLSKALSTGRWTDFGMALLFLFAMTMMFLAAQVPYVPDRRALVEILLRKGRCASCAGDLREAPLEEDGATLCPHCSAAWTLSQRKR